MHNELLHPLNAHSDRVADDQHTKHYLQADLSHLTERGLQERVLIRADRRAQCQPAPPERRLSSGGVGCKRDEASGSVQFQIAFISPYLPSTTV